MLNMSSSRARGSLAALEHNLSAFIIVQIRANANGVMP